MIIVIICTLLRSYPPDSSPLRNSPVILPAWLPPFSLSLFLHSPPFLSSSLFLSRSIPAVVPSCVMLRRSHSCTPLLVTRISFPLPRRRLSRVILRLHSPAPPSSVCRSLSAAAGRRIERKRTRTGPKQPPVNRDHFPLSPLSSFVVHPRHPLSLSLFLSSSPFPAVARKTLQCEMPSLRRTFRLTLSLSTLLHPSVSLFIFLVVARGSTFFRLPLVLASSFAHCSSPAAAFRARFIPTRPCGNVSSTAILGFFPSGFFSPPQTFLACLISGLFSSGRKSRVKIAGLYALNTATCDQYRITRVTLSRDRPHLKASQLRVI